MRRLAVLALIAVAGCSWQERAAWVAWHAVDPDAAIAHAEQLVEPSIPREALWDDIAACESGGRWDHPPVRNSSGTYSGGVMIGHRWWPLYGGGEFASAPYLATKAEQITVAERIADDVGLDRGWMCYP